MFLAYRQTVDMFPVYSKTVDMFLTPVFAYRHGGDDYQFHFLKPCRDGSIDVTHSGLIAEKARKYGLFWHHSISAGGQIWA
jgi:hypothetical protein